MTLFIIIDPQFSVTPLFLSKIFGNAAILVQQNFRLQRYVRIYPPMLRKPRAAYAPMRIIRPNKTISIMSRHPDVQHLI